MKLEFGDYAEAVGFTAVYVVTAVPNSVNTIANYCGYLGLTKVGMLYSSLWLDAESYKTDTDFLGMDYHSAAADFHKVSIEVTCRQNGKTRVVHDTELSGTSAVYDGNKPITSLSVISLLIHRVNGKCESSLWPLVDVLTQD